ncbi:sulfotransferase [Oxynema sp. CENA135]|uniref:sulfotransferase family protein n=1 Tax=Oxynema sp. CENA135 TaxID=984206 RepID=UPI00190E433E|nr:sulfotransferase [Oxynema sp. CENA135]MBK4730636.1 sulfotransferase [Oxynema sp. CENA135]
MKNSLNLNNGIKPLFIFSLPRSGSTLLQRILGSDEKIATTSEPWILLPYIYTLKSRGVYTAYWHKRSVMAIEDFCKELPNGQDDYLEEIQQLILRLYSKVAVNNQKSDAKYFLDKTPRYSIIAEDIIKLFPQAKFIFLWRQPLAVVSSILETWTQSTWNLYEWKIDLFEGLLNLLTTYQKYANQSYALCYENLLASPEQECQNLFNYLELPFNPEIVYSFNKLKLQGKMGDPTGIKEYTTINSSSLDKWKLSVVNPVRKLWYRRYLYWIGEENLSFMGYDFDELLQELNSIPVGIKNIYSDVSRMSYGLLYCALEPQSIKNKFKSFSNWSSIYPHM